MRLSSEEYVIRPRSDAYHRFAGTGVIEDERQTGRYEILVGIVYFDDSGVRIVYRLVDAVGRERFHDEWDHVGIHRGFHEDASHRQGVDVIIIIARYGVQGDASQIDAAMRIREGDGDIHRSAFACSEYERRSVARDILSEILVLIRTQTSGMIESVRRDIAVDESEPVCHTDRFLVVDGYRESGGIASCDGEIDCIHLIASREECEFREAYHDLIGKQERQKKQKHSASSEQDIAYPRSCKTHPGSSVEINIRLSIFRRGRFVIFWGKIQVFSQPFREKRYIVTKRKTPREEESFFGESVRKLFHLLLEVLDEQRDDGSAYECITESSQQTHESSAEIRVVSQIERLHEADEDRAVSPEFRGEREEEQSDAEVDAERQSYGHRRLECLFHAGTIEDKRCRSEYIQAFFLYKRLWFILNSPVSSLY